MGQAGRRLARDDESAELTRVDGTYEMTVAEDDLTDPAARNPGPWTVTINAEDATLNGPGGRHIPLMPSEISGTRMIVPRGCELSEQRTRTR
jgi:hypothetical protein